MSRKRVVLSGYATLDYVAQLSGPFHAGCTLDARMGVAGAWPRAGGAVLYAARRIAAAGHAAYPLIGIGEDADETKLLGDCERSGLDTGAIERNAAARTPRCLLIYDEAGGSTCLLDPGDADAASLSAAQIAALEGADHVCITAGAAPLTYQILDRCPAGATLSWIAKLDHACFPPDLRHRLATRAGLIFCNSGERDFVDASFAAPRRADQIIVQTMGAQGVLIDRTQGSRTLPADPIAAVDATGAGDTLAGQVIASHVCDGIGIEEAVRQGMEAARALLADRR